MLGVDDGEGYFGTFFWDGGQHQPTGDDLLHAQCCSQTFHSQHFGWLLLCAHKVSCSGGAQIVVGEITLTATETQAPHIAPFGSLWTTNGWVRGSMPLGFGAADVSGVCGTDVVFGTQTIPGPSAVPRHDTWSQCPDQGWRGTLDTRTASGSDGVGEGKVDLAIVATNAAGNTALAAKPVYVDNTTPSVSLSGPTDASSAAGTQYITATASAGPSGVADITCSVDGGPFVSHGASSARLPVSGVGTHTAICVSHNNARDANGALGSSAPAEYTLRIRQPTVAGIWFSKLKNAPRCRQVRIRVKIPGQWVTAHEHHKVVKIHIRPRVVTRTETHCHMHVVKQRVVALSTVERNGKRIVVKRVSYRSVVVPPRVVASRSTQVPFGHRAVVQGWLGTATFAGLGGQPVVVIAAPANGQSQFKAVATTKTRGDGSWSVALPPGPSRVVEAFYPGAATTEPAVSGQASVVVPADVTLAIHPRQTHWGGRIHITGHLLGGYVPPSGEVVVLWIGWHGGSTEIGHLYTDRRGRFSSPYTFLRGNGTERYSIWAATAKESDYPFLPGRSRPVSVTVSQR